MYQLRISPPACLSDEAYRLSVLVSLDLLDTPPEAEFDALVHIAQQMLKCPIALVSLVDDQRQWFKARCGLDATQTPREQAFCVHALAVDDMLVVADAAADARFATNPLVTGPPHIRFYAGVPLRVAAEAGKPPAAIGTLCVIDVRPRTLTPEEAAMLRQLARLTETLILGRLHVDRAVRHAEEHRADALRIERKNRLLWQAERMAGIGSWRLRLHDEHLEWSNQVFVIHGLPFGAVPTVEEAFSYYPEYARTLLTEEIGQAIETGRPFEVETDFISATGVQKRIRTMGEVELDQGRAVAVVGVFQDVTAQFEMEQALRRLANQDALTGIANRAGFNTALDAAIERARQGCTRLALILIDLDGFKQINDAHGHIAGDEVLQGIGRRLQMPYLNHCQPARLGGDEFALIVTDPADCVGIDGIAERLLGALKRPIDLSGGEMTVSGTLGISWLESGITARELIHRADLALYEAKESRKGTARTWQPALSAPKVAGRRRGSRRG